MIKKCTKSGVYCHDLVITDDGWLYKLFFKFFFQRTDRKKCTKSGVYLHGLVIAGNWMAILWLLIFE